MIQSFDAAVEKLRTKDQSIGQLQKDIENLRDQNKRLEERLKAIEQKK